MDYFVTRCRKGGYKAVLETDYDELLDHLRQQDRIEFLTETPHLSVARLDDHKLSIKPGKIVFKTDDKETAEELAEEVLSGAG
jgi:hypothetical protein